MKTLRTAKLFVAGDYPDKGLKVAPEDLEKLAGSFKEIPVKVEHTDTVFDGKIGRVKEVWCSGDSLYGSIEFDPDMWALIDKIGAKSLSVGIKEDLSALTEVSIVKAPRVADARIFSFAADFEEEPGMQALREENARLRQEIAGLKRAELEQKAQDRADALVRAGKLTPACVPFAKALLLWGEVKFGAEATAGEIFLKLAECLPANAPMGEVHIEETGARREFSSGEMKILKGLGADPGRVAKQMEEQNGIR